MKDNKKKKTGKNFKKKQKKKKRARYRRVKGLVCENFKHLKTHQNFKLPKTQYKYYKNNGASDDILKYANLQGKTFGEKYMESFAREWFNLDSRISSGHDHIKNGIMIEQKSSRFGADGADWKWQHIEMKHTDWDVLLLAGLNINSIDFFVSKRNVVEKLIEENIITGQGKKDKNGKASPQQAYWFSRRNFEKNNKKFTDYFTQVFSEKDLINFLKINK